MAMNYWDPDMTPGASYGGATAPGYVGPEVGGAASDINPQGAAADPFAYTNGSLLTPWTGRFSSRGYGGGYSAPEYTKFGYADFSYNAPDPGSFAERYADPAAFRFADFNGPSAFKAPTAEDMKADPGYQARMDAMQRAATAAGAHGGVLNTGGFARGLASKMGDLASQEYGNVYNRKASEYDRSWAQAKDTYGINQGNTKQAFDTNTQNTLNAYNTRQNAWRGNADVTLQKGQLGFQVAQGTWDRNFQKARQGWEDDRANAQAQAAASAANANQAYQRDLDDYMRSRDEFWTNQDRQYALLDREANRGMQAANAYGQDLMNGYGALGNMAIGAGDSRAAGYMGAGNAWGGFASDLGNTIGGLALYGGGGNPGGGSSRGGGAAMPYVNSGFNGAVPGTTIGGLSLPRQPQIASRNIYSYGQG